MKKQDTVPCECCQKAFHRHATLAYLYCGHNRVIVFRHASGQAEFVPVRSTEEAVRIIQQADCAPEAITRTA